MLTLHTVGLVTLVSQGTSAVILALLAGFDRRSRGLTPMAFACGLHTAAIALMPLWRLGDRWIAEALSAAFLPLIFWLIDRGLGSFVRQGERRPHLTYLLVPVMVVVSGLAPWSQHWSMQIARISAVVIMTGTIGILWRTPANALRLPARVTAGLLLVILLTFAVRVPLEPHQTHGPATQLMLALREASMVEITLLAFSFLALYLAASRRLWDDETRLDALTGLLNRRAIEECAVTAVHDARRSGKPLALLMLDLDGFKALNDTWGHTVGDRALRAVGEVLAQAGRQEGVTAGRFGGEEFALLIRNAGTDAAQGLAERLRERISHIVVIADDYQVSVTVSIGVAAWRDGEATWGRLLERADVALYRAKAEGRDRVVVCERFLDVSIPDGQAAGERRTGRSRRHEDAPEGHAVPAEHRSIVH